MEPGQYSSGWHPDPMHRFEYRYFNGVQWTSDVATDGQRYVDSLAAQFVPQPSSPRPPRGKAIASFIVAASAVALGWVPFVFAVAAGAAIVAFVLGILGLRASRRNDGYGRGFAVAGIALTPVALAACVGGFFFTKVVVDELRDFVEPGPHELTIEQPCPVVDRRATAKGTIGNLDDHERDYRIAIDFDDPDGGSKASTVAVPDVAPGETVDWTSSVEFDGTSVDCKVSEVFGPAPFDIDQGN